MKHAVIVVGVLALVAGPAMADWADNFDLYVTGSLLEGQGGWHGWGAVPDPAIASDDYALSRPNSALIGGLSDLVHEYDGYAAGQWTYTAWQYVPTDFAGETYFIMLNTYNDPAGPYDWSIQVHFDSVAGTLTDDHTGNSLPINYGQWTEIRVEIDLDADNRELFYGGQSTGARTWTTGVNSVLNIAAVDLFANGASEVYYDDMSLVPEPASCLLLLAALGLCRRR